MSEPFTCFLVDDDIDDQEIFLTVMEDIAPRVRCVTALNGQEAMNMLTSGEVLPDLIFLDLNMPLMNGKQFLAACRQVDKCRHIPVIVLSTTSDKSSIEETFRLGAKDYITKPHKFSEWGTLIKEKLSAYSPGL
ncbi:MAG TPA: response regulator [Chryseosolibacter sp.]|nr:response regulator [Chryseosolibacter sp.]